MGFLAGVVVTGIGGVALRVRGQERPAEPARPGAIGEDEGGIEAFYDTLMRPRGAGPVGEPSPPPTAEQLARARLALAGTMIEVGLRRLDVPRPTGPGFGDVEEAVLRWSRRRMEARLELAADDGERREALRREIAHAEELLEGFRELRRGRGSGIGPDEVGALDDYRLELLTDLVALGGD